MESFNTRINRLISMSQLLQKNYLRNGNPLRRTLLMTKVDLIRDIRARVSKKLYDEAEKQYALICGWNGRSQDVFQEDLHAAILDHIVDSAIDELDKILKEVVLDEDIDHE